jgi:hypothetical protein
MKKCFVLVDEYSGNVLETKIVDGDKVEIVVFTHVLGSKLYEFVERDPVPPRQSVESSI